MTLTRRATAEAVGTALLVAVVVGSGIFAQRLSPHDVGLQLLENSIATGAGLVALILAFEPVSGAHLNPLVTMAERIFGRMVTIEAGVYVVAQIVGGCIGAMVANLMFDLPAVTLSTHVRSSSGLWLGEVVASFGLLTVILGVARSRRPTVVPFAVGAYITAAYWFTSSTSFANPAVTIARGLTDTFAGIKPSSIPIFVAAQIVGALAAIGLAQYLYHSETVEEQPMPSHDQSADVSPTVLFLCVHNAGRSQMALGFFNHEAAGRAHAWSGGSEPVDEINPVAVAAMAEVGIDISAERPKRWTEDIIRAADVVVTMGCGDSCPYFPGKRYEDWILDDPAGKGIDAVRPIRDEIARRVHELLRSLGVSPSRPRPRDAGQTIPDRNQS